MKSARTAILAALVLAATALAGCTSDPQPENPDADGDGVTDAEEANGWQVIVDLLNQRVSRMVNSDANLTDTDGDGVTDREEVYLGLDPRTGDTDGDGLSDCVEAKHSVPEQCETPGFTDWDGGIGTDARRSDSDAGPSQYANLYNPFMDTTGTLEPGPITWGDGIPDGEEFFGYGITLEDGTRKRVETDPRSIDTDRDGLEDAEERYYGKTFGLAAANISTDPTNPDTDGDGCRDGFDIYPHRVDRYTFGLDQFTLKTDKDPDASQGGDIRIQLLLADNSLVVPAEPMTLNVGQTVPLSSHEPNPVATLGCNYAFDEPYLLLQIQVIDVDPAGLQGLDINSNSGGDGGAVTSIWWHVHDDIFSFDKSPATRIPSPLHLSGVDGELWLNPRVS